MNTKVILFDLDGTLLPMDQSIFTKTYFGLLAKKLADYGYEPTSLIDAIWAGTKAMVMNNGEQSNETVFWEKMSSIYGERVREDIVHFDKFYEEDFDKVQVSCGRNDIVPRVIAEVKSMGYRVALATNPIFPNIATEKRIRWAGLEPADFEMYTTYEQSRYSKPNPNYYLDIALKLGVRPEECLMVGNDVGEDMVASKIGMKVFLLTDCIINKEEKDISAYPHGNFEELLKYLQNL